MDIIASLASSSAVSTQASTANPPQSTPVESFSSVLNQVSEATASNDSSAPAVSNVGNQTPLNAAASEPDKASSASTLPAVSHGMDSAPGASVAGDEADRFATLPGSGLASAVLEPVESPEQTVPTSSTAQPSQQAAAPWAEQDAPLTEDNADLGGYVTADALVEDAEPNAVDDTSDRDSSLADIRQRMDLIESAGQLDPALLVVAPAVSLQVPAPASQGEVATNPEALVSANSNRQATSLTSADLEPDTYPDTPAPIEVQGTVSALDGQAANAVQALHKSSDDRLPDSQVDGAVSSAAPSSYNPASLTVSTVGLGNTAQVVGTALALSSAVGTDDWHNGLGQQMIDMIKRGDQQVELRLNPTELGPLSISLNLGDGNAQAQFQSAHASVRTAVEQALPQLREALASQGIALGQASVSDESSRQASGDQARRDSAGGGAMSRTDSASGLDEAPVQSIVARSSGVDLYL